MSPYIYTIETNKKPKIMKIITNTSGLKEQKEYIISQIKIEGSEQIKEVMTQMLNIVTASNFDEMDTDELVYRAIQDVNRHAVHTIDMGEVNRENAKQNAPSSLR